MPEADTDLLRRLEEYVATFRGAFRRRDQVRWAALYLQGLLLPGGRKSVEAFAGRVTLPAGVARDPRQALQNFVNQSPWDEQLLWRRHWARAARHAGDFLLDDVTFVKQGRHSVGVQRQYSRELGHKVNCQVAVAVYYSGEAGCIPLALRLYLPRGWLRDVARLAAAGVPHEARRPLGKVDLALKLLDALRDAGVPGRDVITGPGWDEALSVGLAERGLTHRTDGPDTPPGVPERFADATRRLKDELGLDHFEGRSWRGFHHHACLVTLAHGFLARERSR